MRYVEAKLCRHHAYLWEVWGINADNPNAETLQMYMEHAKKMVPKSAPNPYHLSIDSYVMVEFKKTMEEEGYYVAGPFPVLVPTIYRYEVSRAHQ